MYKVGICGHFAFGHEIANGQIEKTVSVYEALVKVYGKDRISVLDTRGWKKNPLKMVAGCKKLINECEHVIMMPARGGVRIFPALFQALNQKHKCKLHYIVIGGWLPDVLRNDRWLLNRIKKLDKIYVELESMKEDLIESGVDNTLYLPNFKKLNLLSSNELVYSSSPYKLCTFSRIMKEKGIEEAIESVRTANKTLGKTVFELDIFGTPEPWYKDRFEEICKGFEPYINYRGFVNSKSSTKTLKNYFALLFPTVYSGEGFAGTIISAFAAGIPVIATDWKYNGSIIRNGIDGLVYNPDKPELLTKILVEAAKKPELLNNMKPACLERAAHFEADKAVVTLLRELGVESEVELK